MDLLYFIENKSPRSIFGNQYAEVWLRHRLTVPIYSTQYILLYCTVSYRRTVQYCSISQQDDEASTKQHQSSGKAREDLRNIINFKNKIWQIVMRKFLED